MTLGKIQVLKVKNSRQLLFLLLLFTNTLFFLFYFLKYACKCTLLPHHFLSRVLLKRKEKTLPLCTNLPIASYPQRFALCAKNPTMHLNMERSHVEENLNPVNSNSQYCS